MPYVCQGAGWRYRPVILHYRASEEAEKMSDFALIPMAA